ncbi:inositol oxygenase 1-like [Ziziphus jujuba]|uniref:Inositol oxygenase n=1 Tax=Ziziphus jujuba TaxID=326968 RepID=A0ABM3ZWP1_ZIZJJ|nr:inositol oxygenase 1-like [Ziziphus jujuba]
MTIIVPEPVLTVENNNHNNVESRNSHESEKVMEQGEERHDLKLDGGFIVPESNAFGISFTKKERKSGVQDFYRKNHINQTYEFARKKKEEYGKLEKAEMSIWECCELLNEYVYESDPDLDEPQIEHLLQTAESIRRDYPDQDWLHLTALIHDKSYAAHNPAFGEEPQWRVVGGTFPLGCAFDTAIVHHQYFKENPDHHNPGFNTKLGIYAENCGLDNVTMSWGHDEYMYTVAKGNNTTLPPAALFIIRFHSFCALHRAGAYTFLMNEDDKGMLKWLHVFNKYDLYSKSMVRINHEEVKPYNLSLIEKYFPSAKLKLKY